MAIFEIESKRYRVRPMPPMKAAHVLRKVAPFLPSLGHFIPLRAMFARMQQEMRDPTPQGSEISPDDVEAISDSVSPMLNMLAAMPENDVEFVFHACFAVTDREEGEGQFFPIWNTDVKNFAFQDGSIDLVVMGRIVFEVLKEVIGPLAARLPSISGASTRAASSSPSA